MPQIKIGKGIGDISEQTLRFYRQIGVDAVVMPTRWRTEPGTGERKLVPPTQMGPKGAQGGIWDERELQRIKARIESYDLTPLIAGLGISGRVLMGQPGKEDDLKIIKANIEIAGRLRLRALNYSFTALRASEGYAAQRGVGRGGADLRDFDNERISHLPPLNSIGRIGMDEMWDNLTYFLENAIPTAEKAGVQLAAHPNDPPVPEYRGVAQPLGDIEGMQRLIEVIDSPSNCIFYDTGVMTEKGADAVEMIRYFGSRNRIGTVHFRNVKVEIPRFKYIETFHDDGECDMFACIQAFQEVGYNGMIDPDHTPGILGDTPDTRIGWAYAIGQMVAMRNAVEKNK